MSFLPEGFALAQYNEIMVVVKTFNGRRFGAFYVFVIVGSGKFCLEEGNQIGIDWSGQLTFHVAGFEV
jgi:hypothetical protein